jgi:hypothetical protein
MLHGINQLWRENSEKCSNGASQEHAGVSNDRKNIIRIQGQPALSNCDQKG